MKIKIIKPLKGSGYFSGDQITIDPKQLEAIKKYNLIEVLETASIEMKTEKAIVKRGRKPKKQ
ncbi:hypothetical protein [Echinicola sp. 20G]|uniref:hypothetical protein n=1 Tax=Echinicola sp. 20G TaxID=2781961 RepID=UPI00190FC68A|nr:hypothetical protein [Echinicola sp. 20G]